MERQEYIEYLLDHFQNPRNRRRMEGADVQLGGGNPGCGDLITMYLKIDDDRVSEVSFEGEGCTISQAGGSIVTELIEGLTLDTDLRWHLVGSLAASGVIDADRIEEELRRDPTDLGTRAAAAARAMLPDPAHKLAATAQ